jgi:predicted DNA-binding transcriptional regulator AlpA
MPEAMFLAPSRHDIKPSLLRWMNLPLATNLSLSTLHRMRHAKRFPEPDLKFNRCVCWRPETIRHWIETGGGRDAR